MPEALKKILDKLQELWNNMEKNQKTRLIVTAAIIVVAMGVSIYFISKPNYVTLLRSNDPKQLKSVTTTLDSKGIAYKMGDDGNSILINEKDKNQAQVASLDFVSQGMSFEDAFNMIKINTTESDKERLWAEYQQNNLSSKLTAISDNIEMASVALDIPKPDPFVDQQDQKKPKARVIVKPKVALTAKQVQGIAAMVAGSVAGLDAKDVVVEDDQFNQLNGDNNNDAMGNASSHEEMRQQIANKIENNIYKLLDGPSDTYDSIKVVVNPFLDFDKSVSTSSTKMQPSGLDKTGSTGLIISTQNNSETATEGSNGATPGTGTNPGTTAATGTTQYPTGTTGTGNYKNTSGVTNYVYDETQTQSEKAIGVIDPAKSSVAVALYYGRQNKDDTKINQAFIDALKENISKASGNVPVNMISISKFKMSPITTPVVPIDQTIKKIINDYGIFAVMLMLVIGLMIAVKPKKKEEDEAELEAEMAAAAAASGPRFIVPEAQGELPEIDLEERSEVKKQIDKFVKQKPDAVAQLLRNWLSDDWD